MLLRLRGSHLPILPVPQVDIEQAPAHGDLLLLEALASAITGLSRQVGGEAIKFIPLQGFQELAICHAPKLSIVFLHIEEGGFHFPG